jgi:hypothetical protein
LGDSGAHERLPPPIGVSGGLSGGDKGISLPQHVGPPSNVQRVLHVEWDEKLQAFTVLASAVFLFVGGRRRVGSAGGTVLSCLPVFCCVAQGVPDVWKEHMPQSRTFVDSKGMESHISPRIDASDAFHRANTLVGIKAKNKHTEKVCGDSSLPLRSAQHSTDVCVLCAVCCGCHRSSGGAVSVY